MVSLPGEAKRLCPSGRFGKALHRARRPRSSRDVVFLCLAPQIFEGHAPFSLEATWFPGGLARFSGREGSPKRMGKVQVEIHYQIYLYYIIHTKHHATSTRTPILCYCICPFCTPYIPHTCPFYAAIPQTYSGRTTSCTAFPNSI